MENAFDLAKVTENTDLALTFLPFPNVAKAET